MLSIKSFGAATTSVTSHDVELFLCEKLKTIGVRGHKNKFMTL